MLSAVGVPGWLAVLAVCVGCGLPGDIAAALGVSRQSFAA